jgi:hypothetical protein
MMMTMSELFLALNEILAPLWSEIVMFALAGATYVIFTRGLSVTVVSKSQHASTCQSARPVLQQKLSEEQGLSAKSAPSYPRCPAPSKALREQHKSWWKELEELPQEYVAIFQASKAGDPATALQAMSELSQKDIVRLPASVATKALLSLCKAGADSQEVMQHFMGLAASFDIHVFESAAAEASRWRSIPTCRQMYKLAGLASVRKTERLVTLLVRGHLHDPTSMREMIEEILAEGSGVYLSSSLAEALAAQCSSAGDQATLNKIQERAELHNCSHQAKKNQQPGQGGQTSGCPWCIQQAEGVQR